LKPSYVVSVAATPAIVDSIYWIGYNNCGCIKITICWTWSHFTYLGTLRYKFRLRVRC
jgi:hypothetical protein